jgi:hypothetical protein
MIDEFPFVCINFEAVNRHLNAEASAYGKSHLFRSCPIGRISSSRKEIQRIQGAACKVDGNPGAGSCKLKKQAGVLGKIWERQLLSSARNLVA